MESSGIQLPGHDDAGSSGANIEIKVKTMDSQTYTLQVDKQVPVPALKEQIAIVTGVVTEQQRLICRGKVLKDDQLLSAYHVEDGHTLHLVVRQPTQPAMDNSAPDSAFGASTGTQSQYFQVAPGVLVEMYSMSGQGDRNLSDIGRVVSAVLGSIGLSNLGNFDEGASARDHTSARISTRGDAIEATQQPTEQPGTSTDRLRPRNAVGVTSGLSFGSLPAPVIPDAVSTLSQYLSHMRNEFNSNDAGESGPVCIESSSLPSQGNSQAGLPTPESLAELLVATRQTLIQHIGESLAQLSRELENQSAVTDPDVRSLTQSSAMRTGMFLQNLGAYLLELGRTVMTLRLGRSPSEAVVNAGPPVFISPSGPNPLMVQPLPFQPGSSFSSSQLGTSPPSGSGLSHGLTSGLIPRRIDIQIRRGSLARPDGLHQQNSGQRESSTGGDGEAVTNQSTMASSNLPSFGGSGGRSVHVVPLRSMVSAIPDLNRAPSSLPGNLSGLYYPLFGRYQNAGQRNSTGGRFGSVVTGEHHPPSVRQTEQEPRLERQSQPQDTENPSENGQRESPQSRTIDISIYSSGGVQNDQNSSEGQIPDSVMELLRGLFPGGEFQVESMSPDGTTNPAESYTERGNTSSVADVSEATERRATEDGIFFSRMLQQMMPYISNLSGSGQNSTISNPGGGSSSSTQQAESSEQGSSRRRSDDEIYEPDAKRHKQQHME